MQAAISVGWKTKASGSVDKLRSLKVAPVLLHPFQKDVGMSELSWCLPTR